MSVATIVREIALAKIDRNPAQPRACFPSEHIEQLAASIKTRGLIQPITLRPFGVRFQIVAGECRFRAHQMLGVKTIKANVVEISDEEMQLRAIVENLQRLDLNPIEEARAFETLIAHGYTIQRVVEELGLKSGSLVKQRLDLLTLTQEIQGLVAHGQLSMNMAWGVALVAPPYQMRLLRDIQSRKLRTVEDVKHAGIAMRDALAQMEIFGDLTVAAPSKQQLAALSKLEAKINAIADMVTRGFKDGHCETARKIAPDRVALMADKLKLIRKHVLEMEHQLRAAAVQGEITLEFEA